MTYQIHPYPAELIDVVRLTGGAHVVIPRDAPCAGANSAARRTINPRVASSDTRQRFQPSLPPAYQRRRRSATAGPR
jgi:hypothetical protein